MDIGNIVVLQNTRHFRVNEIRENGDVVGISITDGMPYRIPAGTPMKTCKPTSSTPLPLIFGGEVRELDYVNPKFEMSGSFDGFTV